MQFNTVPFWFRIYDVPLIGRSQPVLKQLASKVGKLVEVDEESTNGLSRSIRIRAEIDLLKPLKKGLKMMVDGQNLWLPIKYERLPSFCYN